MAKASKNNARSAAANHLPKIDIVGSRVESETNQFSFDGIDTGSAFQITVPDETQRDNYSLQWSVPIFQGGAVNSRRKQAYADYNKSSQDALFVQRSVIHESLNAEQKVRLVRIYYSLHKLAFVLS